MDFEYFNEEYLGSQLFAIIIFLVRSKKKIGSRALECPVKMFMMIFNNLRDLNEALWCFQHAVNKPVLTFVVLQLFTFFKERYTTRCSVRTVQITGRQVAHTSKHAAYIKSSALQTALFDRKLKTGFYPTHTLSSTKYIYFKLKVCCLICNLLLWWNLPEIKKMR